MSKLKVLILFLLSVFFLLTSKPCAFAEDIAITTYYPAPFGVYKELRAKRMAIGDSYYDSSQHCWPGGPCAFPDIDAGADLIVEGNVGIGTVNPRTPLTIKADFTTGSAVNSGIRVQEDDTGAILALIPEIAEDEGGLRLYSGGLETIRLRAGNSDSYINAGRVGIGTMDPGAKLEVEGDIKAESNSWGTCTWRTVPSNAFQWRCRDGEFVAGIGYEPAEWTNQNDNHSYPEVNQLYCCKL